MKTNIFNKVAAVTNSSPKLGATTAAEEALNVLPCPKEGSTVLCATVARSVPQAEGYVMTASTDRPLSPSDSSPNLGEQLGLTDPLGASATPPNLGGELNTPNAAVTNCPPKLGGRAKRRGYVQWMAILTLLTLAACSEEEFIAPQGMHEDGLHIAAVTIDGQDVARSRATTDDGGTYTMSNLPYNQSLTEFTAGDGLVLTYRFGEDNFTAYATLGTDGTWAMTDLDTGNPITIAPDKESGEKWADAYMYAFISRNNIVGSEAGYADVAKGLGVAQGDIPMNDSWILVDYLEASTDANEQQNYGSGSITIDTDVKSPTLGAATITLKHTRALLRLPKAAVSVAEGTYIVNGTAHRVTGLGTLWAVVDNCYYPLTEVGDNLQAIVDANVNGNYTLSGFKAVLKTKLSDNTDPSGAGATSPNLGEESGSTDSGEESFGTLTLDLPFTVENSSPESGEVPQAEGSVAMMPNTRYPLTLTIAPNRSSVTLTSLGKPGWDDNDENTLSNFLNEVTTTDVDGVPYVNLDGTATSVDDVKSTIQAAVKAGYYNFYVTGTTLAEYTDYVQYTNAKSVVGEAIRTSGAADGSITLVLGEATSIGDYAFAYCDALKSVTADKATSIGEKAFRPCGKLTSVTADEAETIGEYAFAQCSKLTSVTADKAETIEDYAFYYCSSLTSLSLPAATTIGDYVLWYCSSLTSLTFGAVINSVGTDAFTGFSTTNCDLTLAEGQQDITSLAPDGNTWAGKEWKSVSILIDGEKYVLIDGQLYLMIDGTADYETVSPIIKAAVTAGCYNFYVTGEELAEYPDGNNAETAVDEAIRTSGAADGSITLVLGEATSIGDYAFAYCDALKSVTADKATSIGKSAFYVCTSLKSVTLPDATSIGKSAFANCYGLTSLTFGSVINSVGMDAFGGPDTTNCDLILANGQKVLVLNNEQSAYVVPETGATDVTAGENVSWAGYTWKSITINTTDE